MFYGEFDYKLDEKGRLPIPPKFRNVFKDGMILTSIAENCITAYTVEEWKNISESLITSPLPTQKNRRLNRAIFSSAFNTTIDAQGRVALPAPLRDYAQIAEDAIIVGANSYLEIWNKNLWQQEMETSRQEAWHAIESRQNNGN